MKPTFWTIFGSVLAALGVMLLVLAALAWYWINRPLGEPMRLLRPVSSSDLAWVLGNSLLGSDYVLLWGGIALLFLIEGGLIAFALLKLANRPL